MENLRKERDASGKGSLKAVVASSHASLSTCTNQAVGAKKQESKDNLRQLFTCIDHLKLSEFLWILVPVFIKIFSEYCLIGMTKVNSFMF